MNVIQVILCKIVMGCFIIQSFTVKIILSEIKIAYELDFDFIHSSAASSPLVFVPLFRIDVCVMVPNRTARGLQYSGPVITLRVQYGLQIQYNTMMVPNAAIDKLAHVCS